jgi:hypothetical protein
VLNYNDGTLMEMLEGALKVGRPVLVEDFGEELDSALEPLLNRQLYKQVNAQFLLAACTQNVWQINSFRDPK